ncbi:hypothetical protein C1H46_018714 [Malus baccata]|uniref:Uncharacterized protein n=1 Tax=Malus baccata TaxID=106549 RepID=A0A540MA97_MALBA|nr:hypothetical protein C1H46_018714 [Malus baccata]
MAWGYTFSTSLSDFCILRSTGDPRPLLIDVSDVDGSLVSSFAGDSMFSISGPFIALCAAHVSDLAHRAQTRMYCRSLYLDLADSPKLVISPPLLALGVCSSVFKATKSIYIHEVHLYFQCLVSKGEVEPG